MNGYVSGLYSMPWGCLSILIPVHPVLIMLLLQYILVSMNQKLTASFIIKHCYGSCRHGNFIKIIELTHWFSLQAMLRLLLVFCESTKQFEMKECRNTSLFSINQGMHP